MEDYNIFKDFIKSYIQKGQDYNYYERVLTDPNRTSKVTTSTAGTSNTIGSMLNSDKELAVEVLQQIVDLDTLTAEDYQEKYGKNAEHDPYVIASNFIKSLKKSKNKFKKDLLAPGDE